MKVMVISGVISNGWFLNKLYIIKIVVVGKIVVVRNCWIMWLFKMVISLSNKIGYKVKNIGLG